MAPDPDRLDGDHLAKARSAIEATRRWVSTAIDHLAEARADGGNAALTLACARALHVAQQQHLEALADLANAQRALGSHRV